MIVKRASAFLFFIIFPLFAFSAPLQDPEPKQEWILELNIDSYKFTDVVIAVQDKGILFIPIAEFSNLIDLAISSYPNEQRAEGYIFDESKNFYLDILSSTVLINGKEKPFDSDRAKVFFSDIYIDARLFEEWFPFKLDVNLFSSQINIITKKKLPFQNKLDREDRNKKINKQKRKKKGKFSRQYERYSLFEPPKIDQSFQTSYRSDAAGNKTTSSSYSTHLNADFLRMSTAVFLSGNQKKLLSSFRMTMTRKNPEFYNLHGFNASEYAIGQISEPRINLVNQSSSDTTGILVSNYPITRQLEYHRHSFKGELLPDWEVELYRNNALVGYQNSPIDGQYEFKDIPLLFGTNSFRLVFYGPLGQKREEEQRFELGNTLTPPGKEYLKVAVNYDKSGNNRTFLQTDYGILPNLSSSFSFASIPITETGVITRHNYLQLGLQHSWKELFANFSLIKDSIGGSAFNIEFQTRWKDYIFGGKQTFFENFKSELSRNLSQSTSVRANTVLHFNNYPRIPTRLEFTNELQTNGTRRQLIENELNINLYGTSFTNNLTLSNTFVKTPTLSGTVQISSQWLGHRLRGNINYSINPINEISSLSLNADLDYLNAYNPRIGITHTLSQNLTQYTVSSNTTLSDFRISSGFTFDNQSNISITFNTSFSYGQEPSSKNWKRSSIPLSKQGSISADIFQDDNQNGIHDKNEEGIEHIALIINNTKRSERSNKNGTANISNIAPWQPTDIEIAIESLQDPLLQPKNIGTNLILRPGHTSILSFPIVLTGEIDGIIYLEENENLKPMSSVNINLLNQKNKIIQTVRSAFDGFYLFSGVPVGKYKLQVSPNQVKKYNLHVDEPFDLILSAPDNLFITDKNFLLKRK